MPPVIECSGQRPLELTEATLGKLEDALSQDPVTSELLANQKIVIKDEPPGKCMVLGTRQKINSFITVHAQDEVVAQTIRAILLKLGLCTKVLINRVPHVAHLDC